VVRDLLEGYPDLFAAAEIDPHDLLSKAEHSVGYFYFCQGRLVEAREHFIMSLRKHFHPRSLLYLVACLFGHGIVAWLRTLKQCLSAENRMT
jgi:hypothetical protein